jgi:hypothetical protein
MPMAMRAKYQLDMNMTARHRQNPNTDRALGNETNVECVSEMKKSFIFHMKSLTRRVMYMQYMRKIAFKYKHMS